MTTKKRNIIIAVASVIVIAVISVIFGNKVINDGTYTVKTGEFESFITCKGEIKSQVYTRINMPDIMTSDPELNIYYLKINDLVEEGTIVKKGDYVALLDQEKIKGNLIRFTESLEKHQNELNIGKIDSATNLTKKRNSIQELKYDLEYKELEIKQSIYESKSYQDTKKREYDRAVRKLAIEERDYQRHKIIYGKKCAYSEKKLKKYLKIKSAMEQAIREARITAPADGMIIHAEVYGAKREINDHVSLWTPEIAVIPDLTKLVSKGYIEEVDIAKVNSKNRVRTYIDALPNQEFDGKISKISAIGRDAKGVDSKVFDVEIKIDGSHKGIGHGMSTTSEIITHYEENATLVPLNYIFTKNGKSIVYKSKKGNFVPQEITITHSNDEVAIVSEGLNAGDKISKEKIEE